MDKDRLLRTALRLGAELQIDGRTINADRRQLRVVGPGTGVPRSEKPVEAPGPQPSQQIEPLAKLAELMALQASVNTAQGEALGRALSEITARLPQPAAPAPQPRVMPVSFAVIRDGAGKALRLAASYAEIDDVDLADLEGIRDSRGLLTEIVPKYVPQRSAAAR